MIVLHSMRLSFLFNDNRTYLLTYRVSKWAQNKCVRYCLYFGNREGIRYDHFEETNWLPISERVDQFIAVSVYEFSKGLAPAYMEEVSKIILACGVSDIRMSLN